MHSRIHELEFKIDQLRKDKMIFGVESIAVLMAALFTTVFLPQLLFQYVYANAELTAEPAVITYIPLVCFVVGALYFVYATVMVMIKKARVMAFEKELAEIRLMADDEDCQCGHDHHHHDHMMEEGSDFMEEETVMAEEKPRRSTRSKSKAKKTSRNK